MVKCPAEGVLLRKDGSIIGQYFALHPEMQGLEYDDNEWIHCQDADCLKREINLMIKRKVNVE